MSEEPAPKGRVTLVPICLVTQSLYLFAWYALLSRVKLQPAGEPCHSLRIKAQPLRCFLYFEVLRRHHKFLCHSFVRALYSTPTGSDIGSRTDMWADTG
jgi:hypothetical protein